MTFDYFKIIINITEMTLGNPPIKRPAVLSLNRHWEEEVVRQLGGGGGVQVKVGDLFVIVFPSLLMQVERYGVISLSYIQVPSALESFTHTCFFKDVTSKSG